MLSRQGEMSIALWKSHVSHVCHLNTSLTSGCCEAEMLGPGNRDTQVIQVENAMCIWFSVWCVHMPRCSGGRGQIHLSEVQRIVFCIPAT